MTKVESAPGLRFHPTDVELVRYYLKRKVLGKNLRFKGISVVDIYKHAPWDLPGMSGWKSNDKKWYFFCPRERKYASGSRMNRSTDLGYWKTTGKDRTVTYNSEVVGKIKTLVFHKGKSPKGHRTDWVMYEYRLQDKELIEKGIDGGIFVLCAIFEKDGPGPKNGAQYGAPFRDEDWIDDSDDVKPEDNKTDTFKLSNMSWPSLGTPAICDANFPSSSKLPLIDSNLFPLNALPSPPPPRPFENDEIHTMLNWFGLEDSPPVDFCNNEGGGFPVTEVESIFDDFDIYERLDDLENLEMLDFEVPLTDNSVSENVIHSDPLDLANANAGAAKKEEKKEKSADNHMESRGECLVEYVVGYSFVVDDDGFSLSVKAEVTLPSTKDAFLHVQRSFHSSSSFFFFFRFPFFAIFYHSLLSLCFAI